MSISMSNLALSMLLTQKLCRLVDNLGRVEKKRKWRTIWKPKRRKQFDVLFTDDDCIRKQLIKHQTKTEKEKKRNIAIIIISDACTWWLLTHVLKTNLVFNFKTNQV